MNNSRVNNYLEGLISNMNPKILKASCLSGQTLNLRNALVHDAEFILSLRSNEKKSKYLSKIANELSQQVSWLKRYETLTDQAYFIIEDKYGCSLGTVRIYDQVGDSFCWGSWIVKEGVATGVAIESALVVYSYALNHLGFKAAHFDVHKGNESVWRFHENFGAIRVAESETDIHYKISEGAILGSLAHYRKFLKSDLLVEY